MAYILFDKVNKYFGTNHVLKDITLEVEQGELVTLLGPSGCGKSTLLRCLAGLEEVSDGKIFLDGADITERPVKDRGIGMVFQQYSLFPNMTVGQNVAFGLQIQRMPKKAIQEKVSSVLEIVGLGDYVSRYPYQLSGGQQQRVALARAIVMEPKVLLLDEPLSAIDALLRRNLQIEIRRIQQKLGITTLFVTHDQDEAMVMSDRIHLFNVGQIEQSGTPVELYTAPSTGFAATFIGHYNILDAADFEKLTGEAVDCQRVAFRPEIMELSTGESKTENAYCFPVKVAGSLPHGSILRYTVTREDVSVDVDILFRAGMPYEKGEEVMITLPKQHCIYL